LGQSALIDRRDACDAARIARHLGGKWHGRYGTAPCPVCQPERRKGQNALTLADGRDGRLLLNCKKSACDFADILAAAGIRAGDYRPPDPAIIAQRDREERAQAEKRARQAERCWNDALPIGGTVAERYLRRRGITCTLPSTLRFHPACWHGPTAKRHPALVALIEGADGCAVHRTYLRPDGSGKASLDGGNKLMLGCTRGGAVRLTQAQGPLVVAEGIETALSLPALLHETGPIWAALSTSGMQALRLPRLGGFGRLGQDRAALIVAVDGDGPGRAAGRDLAARAHGLGWKVKMADPGDNLDWAERLEGACE
jgi:hypothetical protein